MPINFPDTPATNDTYLAPNGIEYIYTGTKWRPFKPVEPTVGNITATGAINLAAGGTNQNITLTPSGSGSVITSSPLVVNNSETINGSGSVLTIDKTTGNYGDAIRIKSGAEAAGNPFMFIKKETATTFTIGGYGTALEGSLLLSFPSGVTTSGGVTVNGSLSATSKSFLIDHPTKKGYKLRYGSLEGPENGVYVRGRLKGKSYIQLPDHWTGLVDEDSITVHLTSIGHTQGLYVSDIEKNKVWIGTNSDYQIHCFYTVFAERKDIDKLVVEYEGE